MVFRPIHGSFLAPIGGIGLAGPAIQYALPLAEQGAVAGSAQTTVACTTPPTLSANLAVPANVALQLANGRRVALDPYNPIIRCGGGDAPPQTRRVALDYPEAPPTVPPRVWNGFKGIGTEMAIMSNCASIPHRPDEIHRLDPYDSRIPYDWKLRHG